MTETVLCPFRYEKPKLWGVEGASLQSVTHCVGLIHGKVTPSQSFELLQYFLKRKHTFYHETENVFMWEFVATLLDKCKVIQVNMVPRN